VALRSQCLYRAPAMFTGIVEETGRVHRITHSAQSIRLILSARLCAHNLRINDSLAVNGCCLTVVKRSGQGGHKLLHFDLLRQTWGRTNRQYARSGDGVNLERSLRADGRLGGHFVTGHIDGVGTILGWERAGQDHLLEIAAAPAVMRYVVSKGSIAVDGI